MNLLRLCWNILQYFYNSFLGETPLNTDKKTIAHPRYSLDTVFHSNFLIPMFFKISLSNILIFCYSSF